MSTPTPVTLEDLIDETSDINIFNDGIKTQLVSPRNLGTQRVTVKVKDDPLAAVLQAATCDANVLNTATDATYNFETLGVVAGDSVIADVSGLSANVVSVTGSAILMDADICPLGTEAFTVKKASYWTQRFAFGEWKQSGSRSGNDASVSYTLPVDTATVLVHEVVYPIALAAIGTYPPITSAETA